MSIMSLRNSVEEKNNILIDQKLEIKWNFETRKWCIVPAPLHKYETCNNILKIFQDYNRKGKVPRRVRIVYLYVR